MTVPAAISRLGVLAQPWVWWPRIPAFLVGVALACMLTAPVLGYAIYARQSSMTEAARRFGDLQLSDATMAADIVDDELRQAGNTLELIAHGLLFQQAM